MKLPSDQQAGPTTGLGSVIVSDLHHVPEVESIAENVSAILYQRSTTDCWLEYNLSSGFVFEVPSDSLQLHILPFVCSNC